MHPFNEETIRLIFEYQSSTFFYLRLTESKDLYAPILEQLAEKYKEHFIFTATDLSNKGQNAEKLATALGIHPSEQPLAVLVDFKDAFNKYKISASSYDELSSFIESYLNKEIKPYYKSEELQVDDMENGIKKIVGSNYRKVISDEEKDVLVLYYTKDHPKCKEFLPVYEKIAKETRKWDGLVLAKFDLDKNEAEGLKIKMIPHLNLYPKDDKKGIMYQGEFSKVAVKGFLRKYVRKEDPEL